MDNVVCTTSDETYTVGEGGHFDDLSSAFEALSKLQRGYTAGVGLVVIKILSGAVMSQQILLDGIDLRWATITSVDDTVTISRQSLTTAVDVEPNDTSPASSYPWITARNGAVLPVIDCVFQMDTTGDGKSRDGMLLQSGAQVFMTRNGGITNCGGNNLYGYSAGPSSINGANLTGAGKTSQGRGVWWRYSGFLSASHVDCSDASWTGFQVQSSAFSAHNGVANNCGHYGFRARGASSGSAKGWRSDGCHGHGCNINESSTVELTDASFTNCGIVDGEPAVLIESSYADIGNITVSGQYNGVLEVRGGRAINTTSDINANVDGTKPDNVELRVTRGGHIVGQGLAGDFGATSGMKANIPYNTVTSVGYIGDSAISEPVIAPMSGEINILSNVNSISLGDGQAIDTITAPKETPDGTFITLTFASTSTPVSLKGDLSGNIFFHGGDALTLDNADEGSNVSIVVMKRTTGGKSRYYEVGYHAR